MALPGKPAAFEGAADIRTDPVGKQDVRQVAARNIERQPDKIFFRNVVLHFGRFDQFEGKIMTDIYQSPAVRQSLG